MRASKIRAKMSKKDEILKDQNGFDTTEVIPKGKFSAITPLSQRVYLEITGSEEKDGIFELGERAVVIGRSAECDIQLGVQNVSRKHARVLLQNEEYLIEDLESTNGVFVNGIKVVKCVLRNNDQIEIGGVKLVFNEEKRLRKK
jgi:pSer/pThr/pTyr-binding forkhead associated (FHA) protein